MFPLIGLAATLVPDLIRLIAHDKAGALAQSVSKTVTDTVGTDDPVAAQQKIQADETLTAALRQRLTEIAIAAARAQAQAAEEQQWAELSEIEASNENTADARGTMQSLASSKSPIAWGSPLVSIVVTVGFFVILGLILFHGIAAVSGGTPDLTTVSIINIAVGVLGTAFATVVNFWLGDSSGSRNRDAQVIDQQRAHTRQTSDMLTALRQAHDTQAQSTQAALMAMRDLASRVSSPSPDRTEATPKAPFAEPSPTQVRDDFPRCVAVTLAQEGGYVDNPQDPGGATNMGITLATLRHWRDDDSLGPEAVRTLTRSEACEIYRADYWHPAACGSLPRGVDLMVFDCGVNSGPRTSVKMLQRTVGVTDDGSVGPITLGAVHAMDVRTLIDQLAEARLAFLRGLDTFPIFGAGWTHRIDTVRAAALAMV
jgi:hypothetical protein